MNQGLAMDSIPRVLDCVLCCLRSIPARMAGGTIAFQSYLPEPRFTGESVHYVHSLEETG